MPSITFVEIGSALARIEAHQEAIVERIARIEQKIDTAPTMRDLEPIRARVESLEATQTWLVRSIIGAVVTGMGGVIFAVLARLRVAPPAWIAGIGLMLATGAPRHRSTGRRRGEASSGDT